MMKNKYITITGFKHYYGLQPFQIGNLILCKKEPQNPFDNEAICASLPILGTVGYVANSPNTVAGGTMSAGRIYDHVKTHFYARVLFTTLTKVICKIEFGPYKEYEAKMKSQLLKEYDHWQKKRITRLNELKIFYFLCTLHIMR